ncbi:molybdopterin molybdotransferase MoeA [Rickettsiales bacterium]|nr:molybdopterin molybdotransferase MoeA [Rickettsiales bacterium]
MIQFEQAQKILKNIVVESKKNELVPLELAFMRTLAKDYKSFSYSPPYNSSAMDGIVVNKTDLKKNKIYKIVGESKAGQIRSTEIKKNETKYIYTGAPIPGKSEKIVVPKENCQLVDNKFIKIISLPNNSYIRFKGTDYKKNEICLKKKTILTIRDLTLASSMNLKSLKVLTKPRVAILITGDEIKSSMNPKAKIVSSNTVILKSFINHFGGEVSDIVIAKDQEKDILNKINSLNNFDLLVTSGGISVGKYDLIKKTLEKKKIKIHINKVAMKPGKPIVFGSFSKNKYFLGLPGNPVSCYICSLFFLKEILSKITGNSKNHLHNELATCDEYIPPNNKLTSLSRIVIKKNKEKVSFKLVKSQDSSLIKTLSESDGVIIRKPFAKEINVGEKIKVNLFTRLLNNYF